MDNLISQYASQDPTVTPTNASSGVALPSYLVAADNHTIGGTQGGSWFDPDTWSTMLGNGGKLLATSILSGADSLYNTAATVGKWAGIGDGGHDTGEWISSLDDDLGQYYQQNKQYADLGGFLLTSFVPGMGGIKLLNYGQKALRAGIETGAIGGNLARATGLLVPDTQLYVRLAGQEIKQAMGASSLLTNGTLKALGAGAWQNVLEGAAFETMVQATMAKSPILDDQSAWDITKNIAMGGVTGGLIGGAIEGAKSYGAIKKVVNAGMADSAGFSSRFIPQAATTPDQVAILTAEARDARIAPTVDNTDNYVKNNNLYNQSVARDNNTIRENINKLVTGTDGTIGNMVADVLHGSSAQDLMGSLLHTTEIGTVGVPSKFEMAADLAAKTKQQMPDGALRYVKLVGENAGNVLDDAPAITSIADKVKTTANQTVEDGVRAKVNSYKFSTANQWDAAELAGSGAHTEAEARYIWAANNLKDLKPGTVINQNDFPLLEKVRNDLMQGKSVDYKIQYADGSTGNGLNLDDLNTHLKQAKLDVANDLMQKMVLNGNMPVESGTEAIAKIVNAKESYLTGTHDVNNPDADIFARQDMMSQYNKQMIDKGLLSPSAPAINTDYLPQYAKMTYSTKAMQDINGNDIDALVWMKQQQQMYQESADRVAAKNMGGDIFNRAPTISDSQLINATISDGGAGFASFANGNYGTLGSTMQQIGAMVTKPLKDAFTKDTADALTGPLVRMGAKREAAIEFDVINNKIARTTEQYVLDTEGHSGEEYALINKKFNDYYNSLGTDKELAYPTLQEGADEFIPVQNEETYNAIQAHMDRDADRITVMKEINAALGQIDTKSTDVFRPVRPNPNDYKYFAFVKDDKVTGAGHTTMIHATSAEDLAKLSDTARGAGYNVMTKGEAEDYFKARGEFEYQRTLNENYIDSDLKSRGINSQFFTKTDPQKIIDDILQQHLRADNVTAAELVRMKYQPAFDWLEDQGKQFSSIESSQYGNALKNAENYSKNPYTDYIKTALDISRASEYPLLYSANRAIDNLTSNAYDKIQQLWTAAKTPEDMAAINDTLEKFGIDTAYNNAATDALVNHTAPKAVLSKFIRTSNGILSRFILAFDPLNGLVNSINSNVLRSTELMQLTNAIKAGNSDLAGELSQMAKINVPGVVDANGQPLAQMLAPTKLLVQAHKNFLEDFRNGQPLMKQYMAEGLVKDPLAQFNSILDDFTLKGTETAQELEARLAKATQAASLSQKIEKATGNSFFETQNRFLSANVMQQITDLGEKYGIMSPAESLSYRNTFVNRVEANTVASQRPVVFQGPIGQALGLFQSYQFNMMQQLFRYTSEGSGKDMAMLLGLQGTLNGINGMPAFGAINQHIIGSLSGNTNHTDMYDAVYGVAGKTIGDFLMYGIPSSITQTNMYTRGDINPRSITILPNQLKDIPIVSAYSKLFGNMYDAAQKISNGGNVWESMLQAIEHNGISRPLAGLAQVAQATTGSGQVYSTSSKGTIIGSNDVMSLASLSRLAGGRPLDEALATDNAYRISAYEASRAADMKALGEAVKTTVIQGQTPDADSVSKFAATYASLGGKQAQFNSYMMNQMKDANTSQANKIMMQLSSPFNQKMQILMGGRDTGSLGISSSSGVGVPSDPVVANGNSSQ